MENINVSIADSYIVINKSLLNDNDRKILYMLYQPIIGAISINLYYSLWIDLNKSEIMSKEYSHNHLITSTMLTIEQFIDSRKKLEAIGLLKTYYNNKSKNYVYELYSPLSAKEFFNNPILSMSLYSYVGKLEYSHIANYFKIPSFNLDGFKNISVGFNDIYDFDVKKSEDFIQKNIISKEKMEVDIEKNIDFDIITQSTKDLLNKKAINNKTQKLINQLSYLYNLDELVLSNIIKNSIDDNGMIDELLLKKNCRNYYSFENKGGLPNLVYKSRSKFKDDNIEIRDLRTRLIEIFETRTPKEFLESKYKNGNPTNKDLIMIETLLAEQQLKPGVINVLLDYVIRVNEGKLNRKLIEAIASQWKILGIETAENAMKQAEKEYKRNKEYKSKEKIKTTKNIKLPHWYGKDIEKEEMSNEEMQELKDLLDEI